MWAGGEGASRQVPGMSRPPCFECGADSDADHHVVPRSMGGTRTVPLCGRCHGLVHESRGMTKSRELTKAALAAKKARGERTGSVPYGFRLAADGVHLEADPAEARAVELATSWRADGHSLRKIARMLGEAGCRPRGGSAWNPNTVSKISGGSADNQHKWHLTTVARILRTAS